MEYRPIILYKGAKFIVECAIQENGTSPSLDFLNSLNARKKAKIFRIIKRFADFGSITNKDLFKKVEGELWEFKNYQTRLIMYHCGCGAIALTHGFTKKGQKIKKKHITRANRIKQEYQTIRKKVRHE